VRAARLGQQSSYSWPFGMGWGGGLDGAPQVCSDIRRCLPTAGMGCVEHTSHMDKNGM